MDEIPPHGAGAPIGFNVFLVVSDRLAPSPSCGAAPCRRARRSTAAIVSSQLPAILKLWRRHS